MKVVIIHLRLVSSFVLCTFIGCLIFDDDDDFICLFFYLVFYILFLFWLP